MCVFGGERGRYGQRVNLKKNKQQKVRLERERDGLAKIATILVFLLMQIITQNLNWRYQLRVNLFVCVPKRHTQQKKK